MNKGIFRKTGTIRPYKITNIRLAPELLEVQDMMPISNEDYNRLYNSIAKVGVKDPIRGYFDDERIFNVLSGANRLDIVSKLNHEIIDIDIYEGGTREERINFALAENLERRHLTSDQKRRLVEYKLKLNPDQSDRSIAKKIGVDNKTVAAVRKKLESTEEIPQLKKRLGQDGKIRLKNSTEEFPQLIPENKIKKLKKEIKILETQIQTKKEEIKKLQRGLPEKTIRTRR
ncbi:transposase [Leptospira santarosai]|uniref:transposase n=1 Tax=Leptospira santarosai TaxID=28183 RepID=UPI0024AEA6ED|nr:transposase [Leptospira santarosai]MDI7183619.1 transposase [Leptospira santarosai]